MPAVDPRITDARATVVRRKIVWNDAKSKANQAKSAYEEAVKDLVDIIGEVETGQAPLFGENEEAESPDTSWRETPIRQLDGLSESQIEKLEGIDIMTVGAYVDRTADGWDPTELKGVGAKAAEKIQAAVDALVGEHQPDARPWYEIPIEHLEPIGAWEGMKDPAIAKGGNGLAVYIAGIDADLKTMADFMRAAASGMIRHAVDDGMHIEAIEFVFNAGAEMLTETPWPEALEKKGELAMFMVDEPWSAVLGPFMRALETWG